MAMTAVRRRGGAMAEINVTPMADVIIVLLIIFMVTTPLMTRSPVALPDAAHGVAHHGEELDVVVTTAGDILVAGSRFGGAEAFGEYVRARAGGDAPPAVLLQADRGAPYEQVAGVLRACRLAGVTDVRLAALRKPE